MLHRVLLIGAVIAGCTSAAGQVDLRSAELVAERIRTRIEAAGVAMELRAAGEPVYASLVLPSFYERRLYRPAWSDERGPTRLADDLVDALRRADLEGLRSEDYHLASIEAVLAAVRADAKRGPALAPPPDRWAELDLLLTDAFLVYGAHLLAGRVNPETLRPEWVSNRRTADIAVVLEAALASGNIAGTLASLDPPEVGYRRLREALARYRAVAAAGGWPAIPEEATLHWGERSSSVAALRERLRLEDDLGPVETQDAELFDELVEQAVKKFQGRHGLTADGVVSAATRAELNVRVERRVEQLELNLERWRWLPKDLGRRHIIVNIAAFELEVMDGDSLVMSMRVVVGRPFDRTPVLSDTMRYLVLNPYWHVPSNIAATELLPKLKRDPSYLARYKLRVFPSSGLDAQEVDPTTVNWSAISAAHFPFLLRQDPGPMNALGRIKFMFLNKYQRLSARHARAPAVRGNAAGLQPRMHPHPAPDRARRVSAAQRSAVESRRTPARRWTTPWTAVCRCRSRCRSTCSIGPPGPIRTARSSFAATSTIGTHHCGRRCEHPRRTRCITAR